MAKELLEHARGTLTLTLPQGEGAPLNWAASLRPHSGADRRDQTEAT
jgi:hypothetical protein